jgi:hypothetical protein
MATMVKDRCYSKETDHPSKVEVDTISGVQSWLVNIVHVAYLFMQVLSVEIADWKKLFISVWTTK